MLSSTTSAENPVGTGHGAAAEDPTTALYRAALGPVNTAHYLAVFERFDAAGHAGLVWNPAAGFCTLNWLLFRRLWVVAGVYALLVPGLALVLQSAWQAGQWPDGVAWGVLGSLLLLSVVLPGLFGNALLHADTHRRIVQAVTQAYSVREACDTLERDAITRRRLQAFMLGNVLLAAVAVASYLAWTPDTGGDAPLEAARSVGASPGAETLRPPVAPEPPARLEEVGTTVPAAAPAPVAVPDIEPVITPLQPVADPAPASEPVVSAPPALTSSVASESAPPRAVEPLLTQDYAINVGLFAEAANARKARARLIEAGLPAYTQVVDTAKGPRTRVRVGPFAGREQADEAALRIRALGLEAQVFRP